MTHRQVETSRELRLWIGQVIIPAATVAVGLMAIPEVKEAVTKKANRVKESIRRKVKGL